MANLTVELTPGSIERHWCTDCQTRGGYDASISRLTRMGVEHIGTYSGCTTCEGSDG